MLIKGINIKSLLSSKSENLMYDTNIYLSNFHHEAAMNDNFIWYENIQKDYSEIVDTNTRRMHLRKQITNLINSFEYLYCYKLWWYQRFLFLSFVSLFVYFLRSSKFRFVNSRKALRYHDFQTDKCVPIWFIFAPVFVTLCEASSEREKLPRKLLNCK